MSVIIGATNGDGLTSTSNLSNPQSFTKAIWAQYASSPSTPSFLISSQNSGFTSLAALEVAEYNAGHMGISVGSGSGTDSFASQPTLTNWNFYVLTGTTAGSNSLNAYWQANTGGGFVGPLQYTGLSFTNSNDNICNNSMPVAITAAFYMEWGSVLTLTQLNSQFLSATPVISGYRRYLPLTNASTALTDQSSNGYNFTTATGLTNGSSLPTFPAAKILLLSTANAGGF